MNKRINHKTELPAWFSLEKYQGADTLDASGWYEQLFIRSRCLAYLSQGQAIPEILNIIRDTPIIAPKTDSILSFHYLHGMFYEQPAIDASMHGVHALTTHEIYMAMFNIGENKRLQANAYFDVIFGPFLEYLAEPVRINQEETAFLYEPVHRVLHKPRTEAMLGINLLLPDKELFKRFKAYLPQLRKECEAELFSEKWHQPDFAEWTRLGVLPYLDLMLWETEQGIKLPYPVIEEAIFSTPEGSEDRVRKTTKPKAEKLISKASLAFLRAQAMPAQENKASPG